VRGLLGALLLGLWGLWGLWACRTPEFLSPEVRTPVEVRGASAEFPSDGRGLFSLQLQVSNVGQPAAVTGVEWEIWIGARWFALGTAPLSRLLSRDETAQLSMELPVAFDQRVVPGPSRLQLRVRGRLLAKLGGEERRWPFEARLTVLSDGAPRLEPSGRE